MNLLWYKFNYGFVVLHKTPYWAIDSHLNALKCGGVLNMWIIIDDII